MSKSRFKVLIVAGTLIAALAACSTAKQLSIFRAKKIPGGKTLITDAKQRIITSTQHELKGGNIVRGHVLCAELSPDVAQALSESFSLALKASAKEKGEAALGRARVNAIAQLGERLTTIQLLRDGMYRACEAYPNGALTKTAYAIMLSGYDDTMVTLLSAELAACAFGQAGASAGRNATANATTTKSPTSNNTANTTAKGSGGLTPKATGEVANAIGTMRRKFIENINADTLIVACIIEMARSANTALKQLCVGDATTPGIVRRSSRIAVASSTRRSTIRPRKNRSPRFAS